MKAPHTPGPWFAERFGSITAVVGGVRRQVASATGEAVMHGPTTFSTVSIQEANANLIAAVPELLASVEEEVAYFEATRANHLLQGDDKIVEILDTYHGERIARARAALAKARGAR